MHVYLSLQCNMNEKIAHAVMCEKIANLKNRTGTVNTIKRKCQLRESNPDTKSYESGWARPVGVTFSFYANYHSRRPAFCWNGPNGLSYYYN